MSFCHQCGTKLSDGAKFCTNCGAPVAGTATAPDGAAPIASHDRPAPTVAAEPASYAPPPYAPSSSTPPIGHAATHHRAVVAPASGGIGWILPALAALAAIVIAYLIWAPANPRAADDRGAATVAGAQDGRTGGSATNDAEPVETGTSEGVAAGSAARGGETVSAAVLDSAFNSNPAGAAARYAGPIRVSGTIASMVQPGATPSLSMEGRTRFNFMVVNFPAGYRERLAPLSKGQFITVNCDTTRSLGGTTILSGCLLD
ncbi:zinc-ribbon domain-containing protein [Sphingomonas sp. NBWT7]|uniref:zinc-ribbon domain-containing protein n=1 Tax=Sphingomonas sp. NBWT7 TaxID=2596913 RepID=UPI001627C18E|nr:zinc-ribbon domain-containing protein [Sphingomonas sp. NBWT7]